jgi:hypothetical protein
MDRYTVLSKDNRKLLEVLYGFFNTLSNRQKKITPKDKGNRLAPSQVTLFPLWTKSYFIPRFWTLFFITFQGNIKKKDSSKTLTPMCRKQIQKKYEVTGHKAKFQTSKL